MQTRRNLTPARRTDDLLVQTVGQETLVYDERLHKAFHLNTVAAQVWQQLDGTRTAGEVATAVSVALQSPVTEATVLFSISELHRDGLLQAETMPVALAVPTRRDLVRQLGVGALVMMPAIATVMAPRPAQAYTGCVDCTVKSGSGHLLGQQSDAAPSPTHRNRDTSFFGGTGGDDSDSSNNNRKHDPNDPSVFEP